MLLKYFLLVIRSIGLVHRRNAQNLAKRSPDSRILPIRSKTQKQKLNPKIMSTTNSNLEKVKDFIQSHPGCTAEQIIGSTKIKKGDVRKILASLKKEKTVLAKVRPQTKEPEKAQPSKEEKKD